MKNIITVLTFCLVTLASNAQTSDEVVVKSLLGKNFYRMNSILDSLGVWYYHHFHENKTVSGQETKAKIYSIEAGGSVKVYMIHLHPEKKYISELVVNFRHDDKNQVEAMKKMPKPNDWHVGTFSTDMEYKWKAR